jgi:hypothetical protein
MGLRVEALENRQMMFGDAVLGGGVPHVDISPHLDLDLDLDVPNDPVPAGNRCIDFEDLPAIGTYHVGDSFVADSTGLQALFTGETFTWSGGGTTSGGVASVRHANLAGHLGQDIAVNNILLDVDFGAQVANLTMHFGEFGGNLNLEVNGDFHNFENFHDIDGAIIGGTAISVANGFGNDQGVLKVEGVVDSFKVGGQELWIDHICVERTAEYRFDFGDAPDQPYPTLAANFGARHRIEPNVHLGARVDGEPDGQPTLAADGDDQHVGMQVDDEDGVNFLTPLVPGQTAQVEVVASTDGWLNAWIDFDRDGTWSPAPAENIFQAQPLSAGVNILSFNVPAGAKPGPNDPTYSRWRFSTTDRVLRPQQDFQPAPNGEVEDHLVFIQERDPEPQVRWDFGDAPDQPYPTLLTSNGARHRIDPKIYLGQWVEADPDGQPTFLARGDDRLDGTDDEDGVRFLSPLIPGHDVKVEVLASVDGKLDAWIDFNQDGDWSPSEQIAVSEAMTAGGNVVEFTVPKDAVPHPLRPVYSRFRFSTDGGLKPTGPARDGEVEDYASLNGDLDDDGKITSDDIDRLCRLLHSGDARGDLNGDGAVNQDDMDYLIRDILGTDYGDANLDGKFNSEDLVQMFAAGQYNDGVPHNSGWATGDFNCDGEFDSSDIIKAMQTGTYSAAAVAHSSIAAAVDDAASDDGMSHGPSGEAATSGEVAGGQSQAASEQHRTAALPVDLLFGDEDGWKQEDSADDELAEKHDLNPHQIDALYALI